MNMGTPERKVVVIGAGVTGLTTAWGLRKAGHDVVVLEKSDRPGGSIRSTRHGEYLVEGGPNTMLLNDQTVLDFFHEIRLAEELVEASPEAKKRFILRDGKPIAAPMSPVQFFKTPLLSARAKRRLLREPFIRRAPVDGPEESVAAFAARRLGQEVVDYAINPLIAGIYAGDPEKLSVKHAFPKLYQFDRDKGSLLRGGIAAMRARKKSGKPKFKSRSISFREGLEAIIDALVKQVGDSLFTQSEIQSINAGDDGLWRLKFTREGDEPREATADRVIVTVPGYAIQSLPLPAAAASGLAILQEIEYPAVSTLALGFRREQVAHPLDGYGFLVPKKENRKILGTLFNSSLFPGRAPEGHVLINTFIGGMRNPECAGLPLDETIELAMRDLRPILGIKGDPVFSDMHTWPRAIPQYNLGYDRFHKALQAAEEQCPGLIVGGHIRDGVSVGDCIRSGLKLAEQATAT